MAHDELGAEVKRVRVLTLAPEEFRDQVRVIRDVAGVRRPHALCRPRHGSRSEASWARAAVIPNPWAKARTKSNAGTIGAIAGSSLSAWRITGAVVARNAPADATEITPGTP